MKRKLFACALLAALLSGCATVPPLNFTPANVAASSNKIDASLVAITVTVAPKEEATGKIMIAGGESQVADLWKTALDDSVTRMAIFRDGAPRHLTLAVKILKLKMAGAGFTMISHTAARYEFIDRATGRVVYSTIVETDGRATPGQQFVGAIRARMSASNSVQNNIAEFLNRLAVAKLAD